MKPIQQEYESIHWNGKREKFKTEHGDELSRLQKAIWFREKLTKSLGLASPLDKEQRAALKTERAQVIPDALPRVSDGRVSIKDAMEAAINRKELVQAQENMLDRIAFGIDKSVKEKSVLENKNSPKQK